jgi:hypothetical protein
MFRILTLAGALALGGAAGDAFAQRGTGEATGVARSGAYEVRGLAGEIVDTKVGACASTTGRALEGAHLVVALPDGQEADVHLGPTFAEGVSRILDAADAGDEVEAQVFRTDAMPFGAFAAVTVVLDGRTFELRDDNLRPAWARGAGGGRGTGGGGAGGPAGRCWWELPAGD